MTENRIARVDNNDASERLASGERHKQSNDHMRQNHRAIITDVSTQGPVMQWVAEIANGITGGIVKEGTKDSLSEGSLAEWKEGTFAPYAKQVKRLNKLYDTLETVREQPTRCFSLSLDSTKQS